MRIILYNCYLKISNDTLILIKLPQLIKYREIFLLNSICIKQRIYLNNVIFNLPVYFILLYKYNLNKYNNIECPLKLGSIKWHREESLTNIINVELVDLPVSDIEAAIEKEFGNKECKYF